jgi:hypothetical protein
MMRMGEMEPASHLGVAPRIDTRSCWLIVNSMYIDERTLCTLIGSTRAQSAVAEQQQGGNSGGTVTQAAWDPVSPW